MVNSIDRLTSGIKYKNATISIHVSTPNFRTISHGSGTTKNERVVFMLGILLDEHGCGNEIPVGEHP
jgi:hypothetical protein